ncbi:MAG: VWA domain-containing protein, partial [Anaerolineae bacterium]|nr:VWA domain-containing protein [Anaerolineae bacterium]
MSFLAPLAALLAAFAIPIILLYMLRLRRREVPVSSTYLWQQLLRDREANAPWQRLRRNLLLLLQLITLALLVFALMRPFIETPTVSTGRITVLLDASASMTATDVEPSRFAVAQQAALDIVNALSAQDSMTVIRVADTPAVLASATNDRTTLRNAILGAEPSLAAADWSAALTLAAGGAVGVEDFSVVVISDGRVPPDLPVIPGDLQFLPIGTSGENVALTALATRALAGEPPQLFAELSNFGQQETEVIFSLYFDGELSPEGTRRVTIPAGTIREVFFTDLPDSFTVLSASIAPSSATTVPDYLAVDNTAWTIYNPPGAGRVLLMTPGNIYLRQALSSLPGIEPFQGQIANGLPQNQPFDLYILDGWLPEDGVLPDGDLLIVDPPADSDLFTITGRSRATDNPHILADDPRTLYVNFDNVHVLDFKLLADVDWAEPLVWTEAGPLLLAGDIDGRQVAILTFDLHRSDLPLQITWPILLANLMQWYTPARAVNTPEGLAVGETLLIAPPFEADTVRVTRPDGETTTLDVNAPQLVYADTALPGVYTVELYAGGELLQSEPFAVNLFDRLESFIRPVETISIGGSEVAEAEAEEIGQQEFWPLIALVALGMLALEWWLYHRGMRLPQPS